jgi:uncharacterized membrane protein YqjE
MDETTARPLVPAAVIIGGLLLLPVVFLIIGFNLVPLMALTAWSRTVWLATLTVLSVFAIVGAVVMIMKLRQQTRV